MEKERIKARIRSYLQMLLEIIGEEAVIEVEDTEGANELYVNLTGNLFFLYDTKPAIAALEHLLQCSVGEKDRRSPKIILDVNGAVKRKWADLVRCALVMAETAHREKKCVSLNPMSQYERKLIHRSLDNFRGVRTYSVGEKDNRRVIIEPSSVTASHTKKAE